MNLDNIQASLKESVDFIFEFDAYAVHWNTTPRRIYAALWIPFLVVRALIILCIMFVGIVVAAFGWIPQTMVDLWNGPPKVTYKPDDEYD